jgi:hypothetical protein
VAPGARVARAPDATPAPRLLVGGLAPRGQAAAAQVEAGRATGG